MFGFSLGMDKKKKGKAAHGGTESARRQGAGEWTRR